MIGFSNVRKGRESMTTPKTPEQLHVGIENGMPLDIEFIPQGTPIGGFEAEGLVEREDQFILWIGHDGMDISQASYEATRAALRRQ
jgi:hypothetical protein